jgi:hypothetical protein
VRVVVDLSAFVFRGGTVISRTKPENGTVGFLPYLHRSTRAKRSSLQAGPGYCDKTRAFWLRTDFKNKAIEEIYDMPSIVLSLSSFQTRIYICRRICLFLSGHGSTDNAFTTLLG